MHRQFARFRHALLLLCILLLAGCNGAATVVPSPPPPAPIAFTVAAIPATVTSAARPSVTVAPRPPLTPVTAPARTPTAVAMPGAMRADVPAKAYDTLRYIETHNGEPPPGYVGGTTFENREGRLPPGRYREYDVDPKVSGMGRDAERLVINAETNQAYYTGDHYVTFIAISARQ